MSLRIEWNKQKLAATRLCRHLNDDAVPGLARLSFAPALVYYAVGFNDVLTELEPPEISGRVDRVLKAYCDAYVDRWRWYVHDLEKLGYGFSSLAETIRVLCEDVWSPPTAVNRRTLLGLVDLSARARRDPALAMTLVQTVQAADTVFVGHTRAAAIAAGMDDTLMYFGRAHYDVVNRCSHYAEILEDGAVRGRAGELCDAIDQVFASYEHLFDCWLAYAGKYAALVETQPILA